ncbi:MAG: 2,3-bisphosphoglycerate-independent phosphoglycerate mutase [SAR324 cluster bacterium]|nr:2,3-bisphosphoglycerate-independent phosphoglycerate mutase [SAR324 cluster bacterium]
MNKYLNLLDHFKERRPLLNIILDGYAIGKKDFTDGVFLSSKPNLDNLFNSFPVTKLFTHGKWVGLPGDNDMGGSEVGHLTIGAGMVIKQGASMIKKMIDDGSFFQQPVVNKLYATAQSGALHLLGLLSDGNVHSHIDHLIAIIKEARQRGVRRCYLHVLLDGRDTGVQSALIYVDRIEAILYEINQQNPNYDYRIVSGGGREVITMDRAKNWDRVALGWQTHVEGNSKNNFTSASLAIKEFRRRNPKIIDQDLPPFNIIDGDGNTIKIESGDSVLFFNFRGDRAIELSQAFEEDNFTGFNIARRPKIYYAGMMLYDEDTNLPKNSILRGARVDNPFGKRILEKGLNQFRLAETQKYPHVTFFFNGGYRLPLDSTKEKYYLIESDNLTSFAQKPAMKASLIADKAIEVLATQRFDYGLINFANPDMVGHTGDMEAVKIAISEVDTAIGRILDKIKEINGLAVITADHGNADEMLILNKDTNKYEISTKHSLHRVPFVIFDPLYKDGDYKLTTRNDRASLANIAATNYILMGSKIPDDLAPSLFDV